MFPGTNHALDLVYKRYQRVFLPRLLWVLLGSPGYPTPGDEAVLDDHAVIDLVLREYLSPLEGVHWLLWVLDTNGDVKYAARAVQNSKDLMLH